MYASKIENILYINVKKRYTYIPIIALFLITGCYTVPETGRTAVHLLPESQLAGQAEESFNELKQQNKISSDPTYNAAVQRVGKRIVEAASSTGSSISNSNWEFVVFEDDNQINAFAMPGGKVAIYTGMFRIIENDDQLAVVIGHEIAHVAARHSNERLSQALLLQTGAKGLVIGTKEFKTDTQKAILNAYGIGTSIGLQLPFSRSNENEADKIGLYYSSRAGYDPRQALVFWEKMQSFSRSNKPPEFLSTHPNYKTRIENLKDIMPKVLIEYERAKARAKVE